MNHLCIDRNKLVLASDSDPLLTTCEGIPDRLHGADINSLRGRHMHGPVSSMRTQRIKLESERCMGYFTSCHCNPNLDKQWVKESDSMREEAVVDSGWSYPDAPLSLSRRQQAEESLRWLRWVSWSWRPCLRSIYCKNVMAIHLQERSLNNGLTPPLKGLAVWVIAFPIPGSEAAGHSWWLLCRGWTGWLWGEGTRDAVVTSWSGWCSCLTIWGHRQCAHPAWSMQALLTGGGWRAVRALLKPCHLFHLSNKVVIRDSRVRAARPRLCILFHGCCW